MCESLSLNPLRYSGLSRASSARAESLEASGWQDENGMAATAALAIGPKRRYPPGLRTSVATVRGPAPARRSSKALRAETTAAVGEALSEAGEGYREVRREAGP